MRSMNSHAGLEHFSDYPELPDDMISKIVSHYLQASPNLTNKEAIQLGLLSKCIFHEVQKRPALVFGESDKLQSVYEKRSKQEITYMYETLVRYKDQNIHLEAFTLRFRDYDPYFEDVSYQCIHLATRRNLKSLKLCKRKQDRYRQPDFFGEVGSLEELTLEGWNFKERIVWPPNLKQLCLDSSDISTKFAAPKLESITMSYDQYFGDLHGKNMMLPISLGQHKYQNVRTLYLGYFCCKEMDGIFFDRFAGGFPRLQVLSISGNEGLQRISLSIPTLEKIRLENMRSLKTAHFDVPKIVQFEFECNYKYSFKNGETNSLPKFYFVGNPEGWISSFTLRSHPHLALKLREKVEEITTYLNRQNSKVSVRFLYS